MTTEIIRIAGLFFLAENLILVHALGIGPYLLGKPSWKSLLFLVAELMVITLFLSLALIGARRWLLLPFHLDVWGLPVTFALLLVSVLTVEGCGKIILKDAHISFLPPSANVALLAIPLFVAQMEANLTQVVAVAVGSIGGVFFVAVLFFGLTERMSFCKIPKLLQGLPIFFLLLGLMSLAFLGFQGM